MQGSSKKKAAFVGLILLAATPFVAKWEGLSLTPYRDVIGKTTWCYGETRGQPKSLYSKAECDSMLAGGLEEFYTKVDLCIPDDLSAQSTAMFLSLAYNVGPGAFCKSQTIQSAFARKDYAAACRAVNLFNRAGGRVVQGLVNRRAEESKLCLAGLK